MQSKIWLAAGFIGATVVLHAAPDEEYQKEIRPLLEEHCYQCHGPKRQKADLNLAVFEEYQQILNATELWQMVFERVQAFEMPPDNGPELNFGEQRALVKWLRNLPKSEADCEKLASDRTQSFYRGYVMSRRLNRAEYDNTVRDLFGVDLELETLLPADGGGGEGFDTTGNALFLSSIHVEKYLEAADRVVTTVLPDECDSLKPEIAGARAGLLTVTPGEEVAPREAALKIVNDVARRAFRRPVGEDEIDRILTMFDRGWERGDGFVPSLRLALKAVLISPHFLFLAEPEPAIGGVLKLEAIPLASKLSYFIWSSMPDEELLALAESGELLDEDIYRQQIRRMLADPKADALGERFAVQWLDLQRLGTEVKPDPSQYPEFDSELGRSMRHEVVAYFNHIIQEDRSLLELIDSQYTFVNDRLARLYELEDIGNPDQTQFQKVSLSNPNRGGVLGMAGVHTLTSFPLRTSPVLRGKWVLEALLGERVPPPPDDVPELEETAVNIPDGTLREQLEAHRSNPTCASCHQKMDPLGFGLENFDVLGRWRQMDRGRPIDATGTLPSGESFAGPAGLKSILMQRKEKVIEHLATKMTGFAFGRELTKFDKCVVEDAVKALKKNDYRASVLVEQIATSYPFRHRFYPKQD